MDQENGWAVNSSSFDKLAQFDLQQRKNSYFFHLGALNNDYVEALRRKKSNTRQIEELTKEKEDLEGQLMEKMERWEYLEDLAQKIANLTTS